MALKNIKPQQPDPLLKTQADHAPAKFGHINYIIRKLTPLSGIPVGNILFGGADNAPSNSDNLVWDNDTSTLTVYGKSILSSPTTNIPGARVESAGQTGFTNNAFEVVLLSCGTAFAELGGFLNPAAPTGTKSYINVGVAYSTRNVSSIGFYYKASGDADNFGFLSLWGASSDAIRFWSTGNAAVPAGQFAVGLSTFSPFTASAKMEVRSTTQGFLPPVMTGAQVEAIASPAEGLMAYATSAGAGAVNAKGWWGYNGSTWVKLN